MSSKSQEESEKPAKVYQLDAVIKEISDLRTDMNTQLNTILSEVKGVVTGVQLEKEMQAMKKDILDEVKIEYGSTKDTVGKWSKFIWSILTGLGVTFVSQIILLVALFSGGFFK